MVEMNFYLPCALNRIRELFRTRTMVIKGSLSLNISHRIMALSKSKPVRKLWTKESMVAAVKCVKDGMGIREASRLYNLPYETLRRRTSHVVSLECTPGPSPVLTSEEE